MDEINWDYWEINDLEEMGNREAWEDSRKAQEEQPDDDFDVWEEDEEDAEDEEDDGGDEYTSFDLYGRDLD